MKKHKIFIGLLFTAMLFFITSCGRQADDPMQEDELGYDNREIPEQQDQTMQTDENEFWTAERNYSYEERDEFRSEVNASIERLDNKISELESHAANVTGDTKQWYNDRIEELREQRSEIEQKLQEFDSVNEEDWDSFRSDIVSAWDDIEDSWDQMAQDDRMQQDGVY